MLLTNAMHNGKVFHWRVPPILNIIYLPPTDVASEVFHSAMWECIPCPRIGIIVANILTDFFVDIHSWCHYCQYWERLPTILHIYTMIHLPSPRLRHCNDQRCTHLWLFKHTFYCPQLTCNRLKMCKSANISWFFANKAVIHPNKIDSSSIH